VVTNAFCQESRHDPLRIPYMNPLYPTSSGTWTVTSSAIFVPGAQFSDFPGFKVGTPGTDAGAAPTSLTAPEGWSGSPGLGGTYPVNFVPDPNNRGDGFVSPGPYKEQ
jgi:hypothetical protein